MQICCHISQRKCTSARGVDGKRTWSLGDRGRVSSLRGALLGHWHASTLKGCAQCTPSPPQSVRIQDQMSTTAHSHNAKHLHTSVGTCNPILHRCSVSWLHCRAVRFSCYYKVGKCLNIFHLGQRSARKRGSPCTLRSSRRHRWCYHHRTLPGPQ